MFATRRVALAWVVVAGLLGTAGATWVHAGPVAQHDGLACTIDVVVETRNQTGLVVSTETYHREFVLREGETFSDDFSTRTRFKFFDATFAQVDGEKIVSASWFADVTVFNSVEFDTVVSLEDGAKRGRSTGQHTLFTSTSSTTTRYTLTCVEN